MAVSTHSPTARNSLFPQPPSVKEAQEVTQEVSDIIHELSLFYLDKYSARINNQESYALERAAWSRLASQTPTIELQQAFKSWFSNSKNNDWPPRPCDISILTKATSAYQTRKPTKSSNQPEQLTPAKVDELIAKFPDQYKPGVRFGTIEKI